MNKVPIVLQCAGNKVPIVLQCAGIFWAIVLQCAGIFWAIVLQCAGIFAPKAGFNVRALYATWVLSPAVAAAPLARALGRGGAHIADLWLVQELAALTTNSSSKLHILRHQGDSFGVDSTKVAIIKEMNQISL